VGCAGADLGLGWFVCRERAERLRQLGQEEVTVAGGEVAVEVACRLRDLVEPAAEELDVLSLLPQEGREEDLLLETAFVGDDHDQGEEVAGDAFLAGLEEGQSAEEEVALGVVEGVPVRLVVAEVDGLGIPRAELLGLL